MKKLWNKLWILQSSGFSICHPMYDNKVRLHRYISFWWASERKLGKKPVTKAKNAIRVRVRVTQLYPPARAVEL